MVRLFERHRELETLRDAFAECVAGAGQLVIITGGPGIGKTELLHEFANAAGKAGARLLTASGCARGRRRPMSAVRELLHSGELSAEVLEGSLSPDAGVNPASSTRYRAASVGLDHGAAQYAPETLLQAVTGPVLELAHERPVAIVIDDAHLLDTQSLQTLLYLLRRIRNKRIIVVCAGWEQSALADPLIHDGLSRQPHHRVRLAPLSEQGVTRMLAAQATGALPAELSATYHQVTGGNPMLVHALLDDGTQFGTELGEPVPGIAYRQAVLACLYRGEPRHLSVARALAALGDHAGARTAALLLSISPDAVQVVADLLGSIGLLDGYRFRLPAGASAVLSDLAPGERSRLHGEIARLLYLDGAPAPVVTNHLMAAGQVEEPWGLSVLRLASEQALAADEVEQSTGYLRLALRESTDEQERHTLSTALARAEWRVNPAAVTPHLQPLHRSVVGGELDTRDAATVVRHMLWHGETGLADEAVTALAASLDPGDAHVLAEVEFVRHCFYGVPRVSHRGDLAKMAALERATTGKVNTLWATVALLASGDISAESVSQVTEALQSGQVSDLKLELTVVSLLVIAVTGQAQTAIEVCEALLNDSVRRGWTTWQALLLSVRARIALLQGDPGTAAAKAAEALELLNSQAWGVLIGLPLATAIFANAALGRHEATTQLLRRKVPDGMFNTVFGVQYLRARGHHYLSTDRPFAALNDFETCGHLMRERNPDLQPLVPWRTDLAQANLQIGKTRIAKELAEEQAGQRHPLGTRSRAIALRVLAGTSQPRHRTTLLRESIDLLQTCGDRLELALAFADLSATYYELGDYARARLVARQAAEETGDGEPQPADEELPQSEPVPTDAPVAPSPAAPASPSPGPAAPAVADSASLLSDAESRVAVLAALGYTNREISGRIHVTVSTVEQHLTRVYRKLNVASRTELPSKLLDRQIPALPKHRPAGDRRPRQHPVVTKELPPLWRRLAL
ncbi:AAA family ATPase [Kitasatospora sp. NBC_01250]|uniref:helix-turn-helix transcriptional regulator n=1 Tax=Kitasatospora sp. NBC_01250 TaxID=2903571 RepID=UPI002E360D7E|nr:AAA family ATPase [Kitasatospora sp. NBC_01250]